MNVVRSVVDGIKILAVIATIGLVIMSMPAQACLF